MPSFDLRRWHGPGFVDPAKSKPGPRTASPFNQQIRSYIPPARIPGAQRPELSASEYQLLSDQTVRDQYVSIGKNKFVRRDLVK
jgi:hypothetical protein